MAAPAWLYLLLFPEGYPYGAGIIILLLAVCVNGALILHVTRGDTELRRIMSIGFALKLAGAAAYLSLMLYFYHGGDLFSYYNFGSEISRNLREYGEIGGLHGEFAFKATSMINGTHVLLIVTGWLFALTGPTLSGAIIIFSSLAYWGSFFFWKAFSRAFPTSDSHLAATLMFFMPSLIFWTATLGKDAPMYFFSGLAAYGLCQAAYGARSRAIPLLLVAIAGAAIIRPHIASIMAITLTVIFLISKNRAGYGGALARIALVPILVAGTYYAVATASEKLGVSDMKQARELADYSSQINIGNSNFESGSIGVRIAMSPLLAFRPFPWEFNSIQTALASAEGTFLLVFLWGNRKSIKHTVLHFRSDPFVAFILLFSLETSAALSAAFSNFGLLARQRVMFTPLLLLLVPAYRRVVTIHTAVAIEHPVSSNVPESVAAR